MCKCKKKKIHEENSVKKYRKWPFYDQRGKYVRHARTEIEKYHEIFYLRQNTAKAENRNG